MSQVRRDVVAVGLTGGIGAGKSTALAMFGELGALTLSADEVVHRLYRQRRFSARIAAHFGPDVLNERGTVDRAQLAEKVRGRPDQLNWLEEVTHPRATERIKRRIQSAPSGAVVVVEVPLLFEADFTELFDLIVTVEAGQEARRRRSVHGFDLDLFSEFEGLQISTERRVKGSDLVFFNDGGREELREFVRQAYEKARGLLRENR